MLCGRKRVRVLVSKQNILDHADPIFANSTPNKESKSADGSDPIRSKRHTMHCAVCGLTASFYLGFALTHSCPCHLDAAAKISDNP
jgi:hypothetical protein